MNKGDYDLHALVDRRPATQPTIVSDEMASILGRQDAKRQVDEKDKNVSRRRMLNSGRHGIVMFVYMLDRLQAPTKDFDEAVANLEALGHTIPKA